MTQSMFVIGILVCGLCAYVEAANSTECKQFNGSPDKNNCYACVKQPHCMYCYADNKCKPYPIGHLLPSAADCPLKDARWGTCFVNFLAVIISMSILAFLVLIVLPCTIYCCCCRAKSGPSRSTLAANAEYERNKVERENRYAERRAEREQKYDEIRAKYGLASHGARPEAGYRAFNNQA